MKNDIMTLKEVAEHIKLNEQAVTALVRKGEIPVVKTTRQQWFSRSAIDAWIAGRPPQAVATPPTKTDPSQPISVASAMRPANINLNLRGTKKDAVLRELVSLVIAPHERSLAATFLKALKEREELCSTCVDEGVAIPHSRNAIVGLVDCPILAYGRHRAGLDFGALDGRPVQHFFLLCAPNVSQHLQLLSRLARLVKNSEFRSQLMTAESPDQVIERVRAAEPAAVK